MSPAPFNRPDAAPHRRWLDGPRLIGMVHLPPLPGSPSAALAMNRIVDRAVGEAALLARTGFDAVIVENFGDAPFAADHVAPETTAAMAVVVRQVVDAVDIPVGVNVLRNDAFAALAVAAVAGAAFIRVNILCGTYATDQGLICGPAHALLRRRACLAPQVRITADVHVKHAVPISQPDLALAAQEAAYRAGADALIVSGPATGAATDLRAVQTVREAAPDRPVWIGSGVTTDTVAECLRAADGVIVGTSLRRGGEIMAQLDPRRVRTLVKAARLHVLRQPVARRRGRQ